MSLNLYKKKVVVILSERKAYEALSSTSRLEILKILYRKPLSVEEIAKLVNLRPITVRHHLQALEEAGFVEKYEEKKGSIGRPKVYYQIAKQPTMVHYPKRRYLTLSNFIISTLRLMIGAKRAGKLLEKVGRRMGESVVKEIESKQGIKEWTPEAFNNFFVEGYLEEEGAEPEVVQFDKNKIVYRVHNCLFLELAVKMPEMMCDVLHNAFHKGITSAMQGKAEIILLKCRGHSDPYCEYECRWRSSKEENE